MVAEVEDYINLRISKEKFEDFESRYKKLSMKIEDARSLTKEFSECASDAERIAFVSSNTYLTPLVRESFSCRIRALKSEKHSRFYRDLGNKAYQLKQYPEALKQYNKSLLCAPNESQEISIIYANRSAVFFEMKKYDECLRNVEAALKGGYPEKLKFKLIERRVKAKKALREYSEVVILEHEWREAVGSADIAEEKKMEMLKLIDMTMKECRCKNDSQNEKGGRVTLLDEQLEEVNEKVPVMSSLLEVKLTKEMGRHIVAKEDIAPGTKLIIEKPYASILLPEYYDTHCSHCLTYAVLPVPCPDCSLVFYCSPACKEAAFHCHSREHKILPSLVLLDVGKMTLLATRILVQVMNLGLDQLSELLKRAESDKAYDAYDENGVYRSDNYLPILHLIHNRGKRSKGDLFKRTVISVVVANIFVNEGVISEDWHNVAARVVLLHLMNLPCNAHEISELVFSGEDIRSSGLEEIGAGAFATLSLLNHSCNPNVVRHCCGTSGVVTAIRSIKAGEQIYDNYGYHFAMHDKAHRQKVLSDQYFFKCECDACSDNYPKYPDIESIESVQLPGDSDIGKMLETVSESFVNLLENFVALKIEDETLDDPIVSEMFATSAELLQLMDSAGAPFPSQMYCDAQEVLKQILSMKGNVRI